jgi:L-histidine N-alpha-methyltransferase
MNYREDASISDAPVAISNFLLQQNEDEVIEGILNGLRSDHKHISSKYFYDQVGARLFEEITLLPEYYLTRTEKNILQDASVQIAGKLRDVDIIELGSGDSSKISVLLESIPAGRLGSVRYLPVDVNQAAIEDSTEILIKEFPKLRVHGVVADFEKQLDLIPGEGDRLICFFGSTVGNFTRKESLRFMADLGRIMHSGGMLLLGVDMVKDRDVLEIAYNDSQGITQKFNRNILNVVNELAGTDFDPDLFDHVAFYNEEQFRIEMHLKATRDMEVSSTHFNGRIPIQKGEAIHTENSHKFTRRHIDDLASAGGLEIQNIFTDKNEWFSLIQFLGGA